MRDALNALSTATGLDIQLQTFTGRTLQARHLRQTDILWVRSVTSVNADLLEHTPVRYVATATSGVDHVDQAYLAAQNIHFYAAAGSNARAVSEYVISALLHYAAQGHELNNRTISLVGYGHVGQQVAPMLAALGLKVQWHDPPLQALQRSSAQSSTPAERVPDQYPGVSRRAVLNSQVISLHVPLNRSPGYETWHWLDQAALAQLPPDALIINAARGDIVDNAALLAWLTAYPAAQAVLDTWEGEPQVMLPLAARCLLATPHIAGYSLDAKLRATRWLLDDLSQFLRVSGVNWQGAAPTDKVNTSVKTIKQAVHHAYDIAADSQRFLRDPSAFDQLRRHYGIRREFSFYSIQADNSQLNVALAALGFRL